MEQVIRKIALLGATGSIGSNTLSILREKKDKFKLVAISCHKNIELLDQIVNEFRPIFVVLTDEKRSYKKEGVKVLKGKDGLVEVARNPQVDTVVVATSGTIGVFPTLEALREGKRVCLANKETLVSFGPLVKKTLENSKGELIPVDSEHSALFQLLEGRRDEVERLYLTASGGPFRGKKRKELMKVRKEEALRHPTWKMGNKITIDSATLMNKGLELIEAYWLFGIDEKRIDVVIHPQSIIHGMILLRDGSILAHMSYPDMRIPILYSLTYPKRLESPVGKLTPFELRKLEFEEPDEETFPAIRIARNALRVGGTAPLVMNAANEEAVKAFLNDELSFPRIMEVVEEVVRNHKPREPSSLEEYFEIDRWAREETRKLIKEGRS